MKDLKVLRHKMTSEGRVCLGLADVKRYINNQSSFTTKHHHDPLCCFCFGLYQVSDCQCAFAFIL